jgi:hypothetical protein
MILRSATIQTAALIAHTVNTVVMSIGATS